MGVKKYKAQGKMLWMVDVYLTTPDRQKVRFRKREIPTKELAEQMLAKAKADAFLYSGN